MNYPFFKNVKPRVVPLTLVFLIALVSPSLVAAQSADQRFAAGLRERRLYELSTAFCREKLADAKIEPVEQCGLVLQLAQSMVAHANALPFDQQSAAWDAVRNELANFLREHPDQPRREVVVVQHALTLLARGQSLRQEWEIAPEKPELKSLASETLRAAISELEAADRLIGEDLLPRRQRQRREGELSIAQLLTLRNNVQFQLAQCYLNSALLYGDDQKATRVDALTQIGQQLDQLARRVQPGDPLLVQIGILRVECQRRLGQFAVAQALLEAMDETSFATEFRAAYWTERFQLALAQKQIDQAIAWLPKVGAFYTTDPKLCLNLVQVFLAVASESKDKPDREVWQERAEQTIRAIETYHGPYWTRRANLLLLGNASHANPASSSELVVRLVAELLRKNQADEAVHMLDLASNQALNENRRAMAADLAFRAAQIQQQRAAYENAADRFRLLAAAFEDQPQAPVAHLAAGWNLAQLLPQSPQLLPDYLELLREHLATWPTDPTSDQAAVWLAPLLSRQGQWREAFNVASAVRPSGPEFGKAAELACAAALAHLARTASEDPDNVANQASDIERALGQWIERCDANPVSDNGTAVGQLKLTRTIVSLRFLDRAADSALTELDALLAAPPQPIPNWLNQAVAWRALCRAAGDVPVPAGEIGFLQPSESLNWLEAARTRTTAQNRSSVAQLIIDQFEQVKRQWPPDDVAIQVRWQMTVSECLWDKGDRDSAAEGFTALAARHPRLVEVQIRLARMLSMDTTGQWTDRAMAAWRSVAAGSKPHGDIWYEAKLGLARLLIQAKQFEEAEKFLRYLKTVPPGWDQSTLKNEFETLLAEAVSKK